MHISCIQGRVAEWLCRGLQILVRRFDSGPGLQISLNFPTFLNLLKKIKKHVAIEILFGYIIINIQSPSSRGLGHRPFKAATRVRIPLGIPLKTLKTFLSPT